MENGGFYKKYRIVVDILGRLKKHFFSSNKKYWFSILKDNENTLKKLGFSVNYLGELGVQISLTNEEVKDLEFTSTSVNRDVASYKTFRLKLAEFLNKNEEFFLVSGILELIARENYVIEKSDYDDYTYNVYITYSFGKYNFKFWSICTLLFCLLSYKLILIFV